MAKYMINNQTIGYSVDPLPNFSINFEEKINANERKRCMKEKAKQKQKFRKFNSIMR